MTTFLCIPCIAEVTLQLFLLIRIAIESLPSLPAWPISWTYSSILLGEPQWKICWTNGISTPILNAAVATIMRNVDFFCGYKDSISFFMASINTLAYNVNILYCTSCDSLEELTLHHWWIYIRAIVVALAAHYSLRVFFLVLL